MKTVNRIIQTLPLENTPFLKGSINCEKQFELAIETANAGNKLKAMELAREALIFAKQSNNYIAVYIHSFLAVNCVDFNKFNAARIHCYNAMNILDKKHYSYDTDNQYLSALLNLIGSKDVEFKQLRFESLAA